MDTKATHVEVDKAGQHLLKVFYRCDSGISLDRLRFERFCRKVATSTTSVDPKTLPPTSAAAVHHSERVYHPVQTWLGRCLDPSDWGWVLRDNTYKPKLSALAPAPQELMQSIYCGCKSDCSRCSCKCRKLGLPCTIVCLECKGNCLNGEKSDEAGDINSD